MIMLRRGRNSRIQRAWGALAPALVLGSAACSPAAPVPPPVTPAVVEQPPPPPPPPPPTDTDGDGVWDDLDGCPMVAEDLDGFEDGDGCPDPDNDGDGIPDERDECRDEPEVVNGVDDDDGCPDRTRARVEVDRIVIEDMVHFEFGTAVLRVGSTEVLEDVARLLLAHPEYRRVEIRGYTDPQGSEESNLRLSQRRAERIRDRLVRLGVEADRLIAVGMGEADPISPGQRILDNQQNRRVEFVITQIGN
jgi:outer membrane protein OmpA-like peptidoglycan-associated protein